MSLCLSLVNCQWSAWSPLLGYTWTNWCDLVEGGCPGADVESQLDRAVDGIQWDPELQERIREELLMQHQIPEIHISK